MKSKVSIMVMMALVAIMVIPIVANATATTPYSSYDAWFQGNSSGCAGIYRCSCSPISNALSAKARVQYNDNGTYKRTGYSSDSGTNVDQRAFAVSAPGGKYVNYVDASFTARCGSGTVKTLYDTASR